MSRRFQRPSVRMSVTFAAVAATLLAAPGAASASPRDDSYDLPQSGVYLEGIGVDQRAGLVYVSATNRDGTIYRGEIGSGTLEVWVGPRAGDNGRGIAVDDAGLVYVAGGPTGEVRVFDRSGTLLAELATGATGSFLNDAWVGPDGGVYVTDSSLPVIWRVGRAADGSWAIEKWLDVSASIALTPSLADFDLGGIVSTPDRRYLLVAQGTTGQLWRISLADKQIQQVLLDGAPLTNADGIVLRGHTLTVVQNFSRQVTTWQLSGEWDRATLVRRTATPADRTLTTADVARGRILVVDAKFGFPAPTATARVIDLGELTDD